MEELRKAYHSELDQARSELVRLAALVVELLPRATAVLLDGDLEADRVDGAEGAEGAGELVGHDRGAAARGAGLKHGPVPRRSRAP